MKIRFQADVDLNEDIVKGILRREPGVDFRTAPSAGFRGLSDLEVLALAAADGVFSFFTIGRRCRTILPILSAQRRAPVCSSSLNEPMFLLLLRAYCSPGLPLKPRNG